MRKIGFWRIPYFIHNIFVGDRRWGRIRLGIFLGFAILYMLGMAKWCECQLTLANSLRYLLIPIAALIFALLTGARYLQDIYELKSLRSAMKYLLSGIFAFSYPRMKIPVEKALEQPKTDNLMEIIGGPGMIYIRPGYVALFEQLYGPTSVRAAGRHFIPRMEKIKETVSLEDQYGQVEEVTATTKDGVRVRVQDIRFRYRLRTGRKYGDYTRRTTAEPYPFSTQAVRNYAYRRIVRPRRVETAPRRTQLKQTTQKAPAGPATELTPWADAVRNSVSGAITEYIYEHTYDQIAAPRTGDPRQEIARRLRGSRTRETLKNIGTELLWVDIGHFEIADEDIRQQRVATWGARWESEAAIIKAVGESERTSLEELARSQSQAAVVSEIVEALREMNLPALEHKQSVYRLLLARTAQILDRMADQSVPPKTDEKNPKDG